MTRNKRVHPPIQVVAALGLALATAACGPILDAGLGLIGVHRYDRSGNLTGAKDSPASVRPLKRPRATHAPAVTSRIQWMPEYFWERSAPGTRYSIARGFSKDMGVFGKCPILSAGVSRVLPVSGRDAGAPLATWGPLAFGVTGDVQPWDPDGHLLYGEALASALLSRSAELGTLASDCSRASFYLQVRLWGSSEPVVVR